MKRTIIIGIFLINVSSLWAQNWEKTPDKNKWGDVEGYFYTQVINLATANYKGRNSTVAIIYCYDPKKPNYFLIYSKTLNGLDVHPAANFINDSFTLTLRSSDGKVTTYPGVVPSTRDFTSVTMACIDDRLVKLLKTNGEWDILIEGSNWYIRARIKGGLPE